MKQKLFLAAMATIAMTSCSNDETLKINTGRAIDFRTAMATRTTETTIDNLESFFVTAFNENKIEAPYFENLEFAKDSEGFFTSETKYYYPGDGSSLSFHAYAPSKDELGGTLTVDSKTKNLTLEDFSPASDISQQVDFITANATGTKENEADGVSLTFSHRLSQIEIKGKSENTSYDFKVKGVRIGKAVSKGSFDFTKKSWTLVDGEKAIYEQEYTEITKLSAEATSFMSGDNAMLIPQELTAWLSWDTTNNNEGAYLSVLVRITTKDGALVYPFKDDNTRDYAWAAIPVDTKWEAGKKYVYTLNFTTGAGYVDPTEIVKPGEPILTGEIKFDVDIEAWDESTANNDKDMPMEKEDMNPDENDNEDPFGR